MQNADPAARLFGRLDEIAAALEASGSGLALLALGSVGQETARLDQYSDLDFFAIVQTGTKKTFLQDLSWLASAHPIGYAFMNTVDGYKVLFEDGIFAEFAIFEPHELSGIPYAPGRIVWSTEGADNAWGEPRQTLPKNEPHSTEWLIGEALTNLYIGLGRYLRGEKLSAFRFIQEHAVDRVLELARLLEQEQPGGFPDPFNNTRRFEARYPQTSGHLASFMQGYDAAQASALAIVQFLDENFLINSHIKAAIIDLCQQPSADLS